MDGNNHGNTGDGSADFVVKKRGRPRKHPKPDTIHGGHVGTAHPPGGESLYRNQGRRFDSIHRADDIRMGQKVHGVIEAAFDAGYLLTVRAGSSGTTLRGIVFKPGHCVPVSADNDVAPSIPMIRRNSFTIPAKNYHHSRGSKTLDITNGAGHQYDKPPAPNRLHRSTQAAHQAMQNSVPEASNTSNGGFPDASVGTHGRPFETLLSEVMRGVPAPTQADEDSDDEDQALSVEPLRAIHPAESLAPPQHFRTGKMTELLQAVQENTRQGQASQDNDPGKATGNPGTDAGD